MSENNTELKRGEKENLVGRLLKKASDTQKIQEITGKSTKAATDEALRQVRQVLRANTISKSGKED